MGNKVHPLSYRLNQIQNWDSLWFKKKSYTNFLHQDIIIKDFLENFFYLRNFSVSNIYINRETKDNLTIHLNIITLSNFFKNNSNLNKLQKKFFNLKKRHLLNKNFKIFNLYKINIPNYFLQNSNIKLNNTVKNIKYSSTKLDNKVYFNKDYIISTYINKGLFLNNTDGLNKIIKKNSNILIQEKKSPKNYFKYYYLFYILNVFNSIKKIYNIFNYFSKLKNNWNIGIRNNTFNYLLLNSIYSKKNKEKKFNFTEVSYLIKLLTYYKIKYYSTKFKTFLNANNFLKNFRNLKNNTIYINKSITNLYSDKKFKKPQDNIKMFRFFTNSLLLVLLYKINLPIVTNIHKKVINNNKLISIKSFNERTIYLINPIQELFIIKKQLLKWKKQLFFNTNKLKLREQLILKLNKQFYIKDKLETEKNLKKVLPTINIKDNEKVQIWNKKKSIFNITPLLSTRNLFSHKYTFFNIKNNVNLFLSLKYYYLIIIKYNITYLKKIINKITKDTYKNIYFDFNINNKFNLNASNIGFFLKKNLIKKKNQNNLFNPIELIKNQLNDNILYIKKIKKFKTYVLNKNIKIISSLYYNKINYYNKLIWNFNKNLLYISPIKFNDSIKHIEDNNVNKLIYSKLNLFKKRQLHLLSNNNFIYDSINYINKKTLLDTYISNIKSKNNILFNSYNSINFNKVFNLNTKTNPLLDKIDYNLNKLYNRQFICLVKGFEVVGSGRLGFSKKSMRSSKTIYSIGKTTKSCLNLLIDYNFSTQITQNGIYSLKTYKLYNVFNVKKYIEEIYKKYLI